jgi:co-chaperonin GroES (HSP10)
MAVGPGGYTDEGVLITPQVKVGDIVVVSPRILEKTDKVDVEGEEMLLLKEGFILGILEA